MRNLYHTPFQPFLAILITLLFASGDLYSQSSYAGKPRYQIVTTRAGQPLGTIIVELFPTIAPFHAANFDSLVTKKFYDTTAFHRVIPGFMIQGGDPNSRSGPVSTWGYGQPTQPKVKAEFSVAKHVRGILSAARSTNINSATSQFFICVATASQLDGQYSVYGRVTSGMNIADSIVLSPRNMTTNNPLQKIEMFISFLGVNDTMPLPPVLTSPATGTIGVDTTVLVLKWNKVNDALFYHLDVAKDSLFTDTLKSIDLTSTSYNLLFLSRDTQFYWRVKANNGGFIRNSEMWTFTTAKPANTTQIATLAAANTKPLVFPNPGRDRFTFDNLKNGDLIEITDLSGRLVHKSVAKEKTVTIDLPFVAKGEYLYRITSLESGLTQGKLIIQQ